MRILILACLAVPLMAQSGLLPANEFIHDWEISKQFTLDVAAAMPADKWTYKPTDPEMNFASLLMHIAGSSVFRFAQLSGNKPPAWVMQNPAKLTREEILAHLAESFDYVIATIPKLTPAQLDKIYDVDWKGRPKVDGRQMMLNMFVHVAHHRAQAEVYLRLNGVTPPTYTF